MSDSRQHTSGEPELEAPQGLAEDLAALYAADVPVPPEVDETIIAMARERFVPRAQRPRRRLVLRWAPVGALAAAAAVIILFLFPALLMRPMPRASREAALAMKVSLREDIDGSGRVDILDAFLLARHIESAAGPRNDWDMNGDGTVDRTDVDMIARAAVSLERSSVQ